jgi:GTP cyclohydrolase I
MKKPNIDEGTKLIQGVLDWLQIPMTESTEETAKRVAKMYLEVFSGMYVEPPKVTTFEAKEGYVCVTDIYFTSFCEHHLLPFYGKCGVVYWSNGERVIGLSKIPRLVQHFASKPQLQERLTYEIAKGVFNAEKLKPNGVYVEVSAEHSCMAIRGVKARGSVTNTAAIIGRIDKEEAQRLLATKNSFTK